MSLEHYKAVCSDVEAAIHSFIFYTNLVYELVENSHQDLLRPAAHFRDYSQNAGGEWYFRTVLMHFILPTGNICR